MPADSTFTANGRENMMKTLGDEILKTVRGVTTAFNTNNHHKHGPKAGGSSQKDNHNVDDDSHASSVITLAGNNTGASMKGETEERKAGIEGENEDEMKTFVNSNFQAVNNSIMFGGSYSSNDPGVHLEVVDCTTGPRHPEKKKKTKKGENEADGSSSLDQEKHH
ncbi:unnamed protein product [Cuscuta epithymum]|uniref:Uncharacterized protein n=1 Tax=Cuscuta epithymum TaxID=186058 RepID=A0AAV0EAL9_9ASTE|nr:unnamed protein product [Cuscuta epithymum]